MTAYVFYQPENGPEERHVREFVKQLKVNQVESLLLGFDDQQSTAKRELYDVVDHPTVVLVRDDGSSVAKWQRELPLIGEISYLAHQQ